MQFSNAHVGITRKPPMLGEHNAEVLGTLLGLSTDRIAELTGAGILVQEA
jgi:crotonobetainyl-CoA:carnitine CoA-transferase CaiB-like acyl-CoA transferase